MTAFTKAQIIEMAKEFAEANYGNGMDFFIECYENEEWLDFIGEHQLMEVLSRMVKYADNRAEFLAESMAH